MSMWGALGAGKSGWFAFSNLVGSDSYFPTLHFVKDGATPFSCNCKTAYLSPSLTRIGLAFGEHCFEGFIVAIDIVEEVH